MKYSFLLRLSFTFCIVTVFPSYLFAQDCLVEKESLKGTYTGECKKGKAHGKGKAVGADTYEGDFKSGLPDGQGAYTWSNGDSYTGKFVKGIREGKGVLTFKRVNATDSVIEGFWKKDEYKGLYEKLYQINFRSREVAHIEVDYKKNDASRQVTFVVINTSGGMKVDDVEMIKGNYLRIMTNTYHPKKTETVLYEVSFPARIKVAIGSEQVEMEFNEEGSYIVTVRINQ